MFTRVFSPTGEERRDGSKQILRILIFISLILGDK
jgi:hypothetical protein